MTIGKGRAGAMPRCFCPTAMAWSSSPWLLLDRVPRFFQGDSLSYLLTGTGWIPPDRSLGLRLRVNFLMRYTHGYSAFILVQIGVLACLIAAARIFLSETGRPTVVYGAIAILLALDPLLEIYTRFFMSDFWRWPPFFAALVGLCVVGRNPGPRGLWQATCLVLVATIVAVFLRVAYVPIVTLTVLLFALTLWRRLGRRASGSRWARRAESPPCCRLDRGGQFGSSSPIAIQASSSSTKLSGVLLASNFAPAFAAGRFRACRYSDNERAIRGPPPGRTTTGDRPDLGRSPTISTSSSRTRSASSTTIRQWWSGPLGNLVWSAFDAGPRRRRGGVFAQCAALRATAEWRRKFNTEMGVSRPLPADFRRLLESIFGRDRPGDHLDMVASPAPLLGGLPFLSLQLLLGIIAAAYLVLGERRAAQPCSSRGWLPFWSPRRSTRWKWWLGTFSGRSSASYLLIGWRSSPYLRRPFRHNDA